MNEQFGTGGLLQQPVGADMVEMAVGVDDLFDQQAPFRNLGEDQFTVCPRIDNHSHAGPLAAEHEAVDPKLSYHDDIEDDDSPGNWSRFFP